MNLKVNVEHGKGPRNVYSFDAIKIDDGVYQVANHDCYDNCYFWVIDGTVLFIDSDVEPADGCWEKYEFVKIKADVELNIRVFT